MKRYFFHLSGIVILFMSAGLGFSDVDGLWVAQQIDQRETGEDAKLQMNMILIDKKERERKRNLFIMRKQFNSNDRLLLKFTYPNDIKGTALLVWENRGKDNERFLYLPALGRIRRITTNEKDENFAGTDFSYEDISGRKLEDYTYQLIEEEVIYNTKECYLLASYPSEKDAKFPKIISWVTKDTFVVIKAEYYNRRGELEKTYRVDKLEKIDEIWTPLEFQMENHDLNHKTISVVTDVEYNTGIPEHSFELRELEK